MTAILDSGIYSVAPEIYHQDPCPQPSLSGSVGIPLIHRSPRHAWWAHPRLNPNHVNEQSKRLDLGSAAHALVLGAGAKIEVIEAEDYRTNAAKGWRDKAYAEGRIPVLRHVYHDAVQMAEAAKVFFDAAIPSWTAGKPEQVLIWREGEVWCRGMVDWLTTDLLTVVDYKTTGLSANPADAERGLFDLNYHFKTAFYERGLNVLDPANTGRRRFLFVFQETEAPFECSLLRLSEGAMTIGRKQATYAIRRWQQCMGSREWPGYGTVEFCASTPPWIEKRWLEREMNDPFATGETHPGETMPVYSINGNKGF